ncbi:hypothetical protein BGX29_009627 [Mortierella sp. GBA35]|nr:hypothetical protein BGX29_009627 [Mortierella sp. GBA35]
MFPKVTSYGGAFTVDIQHMQDYTQLRELRILNPLTEPEVFHLLDHLPSLDRLHVEEIRLNRNNFSTPSAPLNLQYGLKSLTVLTNTYGRQTKAHINILTRVPLLTEFVTDYLAQNTAKALVTHCPRLEILRQPSYLVAIQMQQTPLNTLNLVLKGCRNLKVVDMYTHRIAFSELDLRPRISLKLEVLRFKVVDIPRLTKEEEYWMDEGMRVTKTTDEASLLNHMKFLLSISPTLGLNDLNFMNIVRAMDKRVRYLATQRRLLEQLAEPTNLRVVDFGYDYKDKCEYKPRNGSTGQVGAPF